MGVSISQYRQAIGRFNSVKFVRSTFIVRCNAFPITCLLIIIISILLFCSGTVELNPGPNANVIPKLKNLTICHVNIRGLNISKLRALKTSLCDRFDIITLSETFLSPTTNDCDLKLPGFHDIIRRDRPTLGGGVAIYVKESIAFKRIYECECANLEQIWLQLYTNEGKILICNLYRPPTFQNFWELIDTNLENVKLRYINIKSYLILGDLNADFSDRNGNF